MARRYQARTNRGPLPGAPVAPSLEIDQADAHRGAKAFEDWHWGNGPAQVADWDDPDMPPMLIECGRLIRLHVRAPRANPAKHPRRERDAMIELSRQASSASHVAFDPDHPHQRLYLLANPRVLPALRKRFWAENEAPAMPLGQLALLAGGRHGGGTDYPSVMVKPVGVLTAVVYNTNKKGDGQSYYIHHMGEMSHHFPILAVDVKGRLWLAGGNYTSPSPGITD